MYKAYGSGLSGLMARGSGLSVEVQGFRVLGIGLWIMDCTIILPEGFAYG